MERLVGKIKHHTAQAIQGSKEQGNDAGSEQDKSQMETARSTHDGSLCRLSIDRFSHRRPSRNLIRFPWRPFPPDRS